MPDGGVRLIGVSLAGLGDEPPPALFDDEAGARRPTEPSRPPAAHDAHDDGRRRRTRGAARPRPRHRASAAAWRPGDDVTHAEHGHGWVQGAGHGRVTVRFETRTTGPGRARTLAADDPALPPADPLGSLA